MEYDEVWSKIDGFDYYWVSSKGNVYSTFSKKLLSAKTTNKGYAEVLLQGKSIKVHKIVALTFLDNPNNFPSINHKDENKLNNSVENLEWCSIRYNCSYWTREDRIRHATGARKIIYSCDGSEFVYPSARAASIATGISQHTIHRYCKSEKLPYWSTYEFRYFGDKPKEKDVNKRRKPVLQIKNGVVIAEYSSVEEAFEKTGIYDISKCCNGRRPHSCGYQWKFKNA